MSDPSRILIVGDSSPALDRALDELGLTFTSTRVRNNADFRRRLEQGADLVLFDDTSSGFDVTEALKLVRGHRNVSLIFQCDPSAESAALEAMRQGASDYICRDRPARLKFAVQQAMARHEPRRPRGEPIAGVTRVITKRNFANLASQASELSFKHFKRFFDWAAVGLAQTDVATGRLVRINRRFCQLLDRSRQELEELTFAAITHPADRDLDLRMKELLQTGAIREYTRKKRYLRANGSEVWVHLTVSAMWAPGKKPDFCIVVAQDITEQKQLETQVQHAQRMESIGTLAGGIAHDFNNILAVIDGYAQLAEMSLKENPAVRDHLQAVMQASSRAADLVRQILSLSSRQPVERRPIQLRPIVAEGLRLLRATIPRTIDFDLSLASDAPVVLADPTQISQILMNLGTNAAYAMKDRTGRFQVRLEKCMVDHIAADGLPQIRPGTYARLCVGDTGCGMDEMTQRRIFEPLFTTKPPGAGTGLGLAVVQGIMHAYEGVITVSSELGKGTTFHLYFPEHNAEIPKAAAKEEEKEVPRGGGARLLFVDDEELLARWAQKILSSVGYRVEIATLPSEALAAVRANPQHFAAVFTDQTMPGMTGLVLAARLREICPELPVILMSGSNFSLTQEQAAAAGIRELLLKPTTLHSLATAAAKALSARIRP